MIIGLDHILIAVKDVGEALEAYRRLGFDAQRGGEHPGMGTYNALVPLADGCYLELIGVRDAVRATQFPHTRRIVQALERENRLSTYALDSSDLEADVQAARARGLDVSDPIAGERLRPDGQRVAWKTAHPAEEGLPFLLQDVTPRETRIAAPTQGLGQHLHVREVVHGTQNTKDLERALAQLTGTRATGRVTFGRGAVRVVPAASEGPVELVLACDDLSAIASEWARRGVEFLDQVKGPFGRELRPRETLGAAWVLTRRESSA